MIFMSKQISPHRRVDVPPLLECAGFDSNLMKSDMDLQIAMFLHMCLQKFCFILVDFCGLSLGFLRFRLVF